MMLKDNLSLKRHLKEITGIRDIERLLDKYYVILSPEPSKETKRTTRSSFAISCDVARNRNYKK